MFRVEISSRKSYWVEMTPDNGINKGGFFCEVYADDTKDFKIGEFTINRSQLSVPGHLGKAFGIAKLKIQRDFR